MSDLRLNRRSDDPGEAPEHIEGEPSWMTVPELFRYLGIEPTQRNLNRIEDLVIDMKVEVDLDSTGEITAVDASQAKDVLWGIYKDQHGYYPDSEEAKEVAVKFYVKKRAAKKAARTRKRKNLEKRVSMRRRGS